MDKPIAMPLKEYLLRIMSVRTNTPEKIIEAVIEHQYNGVVEQMHSSKANSVEVSGFGKFLFNKKKALLKWDEYTRKKGELEEALVKDPAKKNIEEKVKGYARWSENIKPRIDELRANSGRVEEQDSA